MGLHKKKIYTFIVIVDNVIHYSKKEFVDILWSSRAFNAILTIIGTYYPLKKVDLWDFITW